MKRTSIIIGMLLCLAFGLKGQTHDIEVQIKGIRSETGNILIMAQTGKGSQPIYGSAKAQRGQVSITLKGFTEEKYQLSAFHDENCNWQLDMDEQKRPLEGVAQAYYQYDPKQPNCQMSLFYLPNQ